MLLTHFIWQTDLKPLSVTNAKNGAIPLSLTSTIHTSHARCDKASEWVGGSLQCRRGLLGILWMSPFGCRRSILVILWMSLRVGIVPYVSKIDTLGLFLSLLKCFLRTSVLTHMLICPHTPTQGDLLVQAGRAF